MMKNDMEPITSSSLQNLTNNNQISNLNLTQNQNQNQVKQDK